APPAGWPVCLAKHRRPGVLVVCAGDGAERSCRASGRRVHPFSCRQPPVSTRPHSERPFGWGDRIPFIRPGAALRPQFSALLLSAAALAVFALPLMERWTEPFR